MISAAARFYRFYKDIRHGVLGILTELLLVAVIMLSGLVICVIWWGIFR